MKNGDTAAFAAPGIPGMTKREFMAAIVLAANGVSPKSAVEFADALLQELAKNG